MELRRFVTYVSSEEWSIAAQCDVLCPRILLELTHKNEHRGNRLPALLRIIGYLRNHAFSRRASICMFLYTQWLFSETRSETMDANPRS